MKDKWAGGREKGHLNICEQQRSRPACASAQSGQYHRCSRTQQRDLVDDIGLTAKFLTRRVSA